MFFLLLFFESGDCYVAVKVAVKTKEALWFLSFMDLMTGKLSEELKFKTIASSKKFKFKTN